MALEQVIALDLAVPLELNLQEQLHQLSKLQDLALLIQCLVEQRQQLANLQEGSLVLQHPHLGPLSRPLGLALLQQIQGLEALVVQLLEEVCLEHLHQQGYLDQHKLKLLLLEPQECLELQQTLLLEHRTNQLSLLVETTHLIVCLASPRLNQLRQLPYLVNQLHNLHPLGEACLGRRHSVEEVLEVLVQVPLLEQQEQQSNSTLQLELTL